MATAQKAAAPLRRAAGPATGPRPGRRRASLVPVLLVLPYTVLLLAFGLGPAVYALWLSFTDATGGFAGVDNYARVVQDFRFPGAARHVALFVGLWLVLLVVLVVVLALLVHAVSRRWVGTALRFAYYVPGALAGASSVLLWLFLLNPVASPAAPLLRLLGYESFNDTIQPTNLPVVFALIAFWTGAGGWILVMFGALNNIPDDVMEAARIDGAGPVRIAWSIQLPLIRKWVTYMVILSLAAGTQLFVEPTLLSQASNAVVPNDYSLNQLAYQYAFSLADFNGSAAISVLLLVVSLGLSSVFVARGGLFDTDAS
ncbi:carbohydrate ABC transporter permease [Aquipuribacter sp. SD81]|uniref:carbohydrate ABC transporter permease n=1 Tax=Aquipuribacter sp. SD81 TaxID=3127703 RepID=UPI00301830C4